MLDPVIRKNDRKAKWLIGIFSILVFTVIVILGRVNLDINPDFDVHIFAKVNAIINSFVTALLIAALIAVKLKHYVVHMRLMLTAMVLSILFLLSYIAHHLLAGDTKFGGTGTIRYVYYFILGTHIFLAALVLPFILFTAYRGLTADFARHRKLARITWPVWFYVSVTGVAVYLMISPYY